MSITAYKVEAVGHDRTGEDYGYVNIMYRYGNKQSCPRPDQCEKMEVMWADESVYGPPAPGSKVGDFIQTWLMGSWDCGVFTHREIAQRLMDTFTGQVCAESIGPYQHSGTGGATDFAWGAYHAKGGRAILAQTATTKQGTLSRIVPTLDPGAIVSVSRNLTDLVVTEYGVAKLRQRTVRQRVENLIAVAHPDFRAELRRQANRLLYF